MTPEAMREAAAKVAEQGSDYVGKGSGLEAQDRAVNAARKSIAAAIRRLSVEEDAFASLIEKAAKAMWESSAPRLVGGRHRGSVKMTDYDRQVYRDHARIAAETFYSVRPKAVLATTPPSDAGSTTRSGGEGVRACQVPPPGWRCTRAASHDGPCAAIPDGDLQNEIADALDDSLDMDWTGRVGARAVMALLRSKGMVS